MRWKGGRRSSNVEDRRGQGSGYNTARSGSGLLSFVPMLVKTKTGRIMLLIGVVVFFGSRMMGIDLLPMLLGEGGVTTTTGEPRELTAEEKEMGTFVETVLADTEDTWRVIFREQGATYQDPKLIFV